MLDERLQQMGASRLADRGDIDKEDWPAIEAWIDSVVAALPTLKLKTAEQMGLTSGEPPQIYIYPCIPVCSGSSKIGAQAQDSLPPLSLSSCEGTNAAGMKPLGAVDNHKRQTPKWPQLSEPSSGSAWFSPQLHWAMEAQSHVLEYQRQIDRHCGQVPVKLKDIAP